MYSPIISTNPKIMSDEIQRLKNQNVDIDNSIENISLTMSEMGAKNLLPYPYYNTTKTTSGVTITDLGDGSLDFDGSSTSQGVKFALIADDENQAFPLEKTKYLLTWGDTTTPRIDLTLVKQDNTTESVQGTSGYIEIDNTDGSYKSMYYVRFRTSATAVFDHKVVQPMLRYATFENTTWVPYSKTNKQLTDDVNALKCTKTTAGVYKLEATVAADGSVSYEWVEVV